MAAPKKTSKAAAKTESSESKKSAATDKSAGASAKADKPVHVAPVVNLSLAAQSAASMLAARKNRVNGESTGGVNAAAFKNIKNSLTQPQHAATSPLAGLNKQPKPAGSPGYARVGGHHQNGGANVARTGVPRRTSGG